MTNRDLDWLAAESPQRTDIDPGARERALSALTQHIASHRRKPGFDLTRFFRLRRFGIAAAAGAAAITAAVVLPLVGHGGVPTSATQLTPSAPTPAAAAHHHQTVSSPLVRLAAYVSTSDTPAGNATLIARTTSGTTGSVTVYDLYADNGAYFFSPTESGLAGQVRTDHSLGGGVFAREVAAAKLAATGDVQTAGEDMAIAPDPSKHIPQTTQTQTVSKADAVKEPGARPGDVVGGSLYDNWAWENSQDALIAGASQPAVRAGVLQILATLPGITVTHGTSDGQPTLVLTAGTAEVGAGEMEQVTINSDTGMPIQEVGGPTNGPDGTVSYKVSRVTLAKLASGTANGEGS